MRVRTYSIPFSRHGLCLWRISRFFQKSHFFKNHTFSKITLFFKNHTFSKITLFQKSHFFSKITLFQKSHLLGKSRFFKNHTFSKITPFGQIPGFCTLLQNSVLFQNFRVFKKFPVQSPF